LKNDLSQAKRLIRKCLETQNPYLNLDNCGIRDLDDFPELFECKHLEMLILNHYSEVLVGADYKVSDNIGPINTFQTIPEKITNLKKLKTLIIKGGFSCQTNDISFLSDLTGLETLDIRGNYIYNFHILTKLPRLQCLGVQYTSPFDYSFLSNLTELNHLSFELEIGIFFKLYDLANKDSIDLSFLSDLTGLQSLDLHNCCTSDISFLLNLINLQTLNLDSNKISDISPLSDLINLHKLNLDGNKISDISALSNLTQLYVFIVSWTN
jgi:Leucine-rich repeat (LRR) protein